jgi:hypothetical protein
MAYFSGQGRVYIGQRDSNGNPLALRWLGNVPELKIQLKTETMEHKEAYSGQRFTDLQLIKSKDGEFSTTVEDFNLENLELTLYGQTSTVTAGTVTNEALPSGAVAGGLYLLANQFVSAVTVKDSNGSPATLAAGTDYKVHAEQGAIELLNVTGFTQPFKVDYSYGAVKRLAMFKTAQPEVWLRFDGLNTADINKRVIVDLYRVVLNPTKDFSLIGNDLQKFDLSGRVLADLTKSETGPLGLFGRVIQASV